MTEARISRGNEAIGEALNEHAEGARSKLNEIKDTVGHYYEEGLEKAKQFERSLEHGIQERPLQAVLIAAGVGLATGILVGTLVRRS